MRWWIVSGICFFNLILMAPSQAACVTLDIGEKYKALAAINYYRVNSDPIPFGSQVVSFRIDIDADGVLTDELRWENGAPGRGGHLIKASVYDFKPSLAIDFDGDLTRFSIECKNSDCISEKHIRQSIWAKRTLIRHGRSSVSPYLCRSVRRLQFIWR